MTEKFDIDKVVQEIKDRDNYAQNKTNPIDGGDSRKVLIMSTVKHDEMAKYVAEQNGISKSAAYLVGLENQVVKTREAELAKKAQKNSSDKGEKAIKTLDAPDVPNGIDWEPERETADSEYGFEGDFSSKDFGY